MSERERAFREIAEAVLSDSESKPYGSCCGCSNVGDDVMIFLRDRFPDDLPYIYNNDDLYNRKAWIDDAREDGHE